MALIKQISWFPILTRFLQTIGACAFVYVSGAEVTDAQPLSGTWRGQCVRPGHDPATGNLIIQGGAVTFYGAPVEALDLRIPAIAFNTRQGSAGILRHFVGSFSPDLRNVTGTLIEQSQKWADCSFAYVG